MHPQALPGFSLRDAKGSGALEDNYGVLHIPRFAGADTVFSADERQAPALSRSRVCRRGAPVTRRGYGCAFSRVNRGSPRRSGHTWGRFAARWPCYPAERPGRRFGFQEAKSIPWVRRVSPGRFYNLALSERRLLPPQLGLAREIEKPREGAQRRERRTLGLRRHGGELGRRTGRGIRSCGHHGELWNGARARRGTPRGGAPQVVSRQFAFGQPRQSLSNSRGFVKRNPHSPRLSTRPRFRSRFSGPAPEPFSACWRCTSV